jgi:uncharacterized membrane protein
MDNMIFEIIGYVASVVTAVSLTMKNIHRLRWWNLFGAATFSAYGAIIGAWPVFALNGFVAIVDIYYLIEMSRRKEYFDLLEIDIKNSIFTKRFLNFYSEDISKYFPRFNFDQSIFLFARLSTGWLGAVFNYFGKRTIGRIGLYHSRISGHENRKIFLSRRIEAFGYRQ